MARILVLYGSYRSDRMGIRLANYLVDGLKGRGDDAELIDAKAVGLPMLDRMYKEYPKGSAPAPMEALAEKIRTADAFVFVTGEYNWGVQPGLKNLTDHFLEEWFWRPAAIRQLFGRPPGRRAIELDLARHPLRDGHGRDLEHAHGRAGRTDPRRGERLPTGPGGQALASAFPRHLPDDLAWWTEAAKAQRARQAPPY